MSRSLRVQRFLLQYGFIIAILLVFIGVGAGIQAYNIYSNPPTETVTEETNVETVETSVTTSAVVTGESSLYEQGRRLVNQPAYLISATPNLTYHVETQVPTGKTVSVNQRLIFRMTATRSNQIFWRDTRILVANKKAVQEGEVKTSVTVNMSTLSALFEKRSDQLGGIGQVSSEVVLNVTYDTGRYSGELSTTAPLRFASASDAYWISGEVSAGRTHSKTETAQVTRSPNRIAYLGFSLIGIFAISGAGYIVYLIRRRIEFDINEIEIEISRAEYEEWISEGQIPTDPERKYINIASLEDLVDIAYDSDKRVIHDQEYDVYAVTDGDIVYYFTKGELEIDTWLNI